MELSLDRENILEFNVDIQGYANNPTTSKPQVRMVIGNKVLSVCLPALKEGEDYTVTIPEMKNVLESGDYEASLEVILDNKFFVPWESTITFDKEVKVEAAPGVKKPKPTMKVTAKPVIKEQKKKGLQIINDLPRRKKKRTKKRL